jgi:hypothetical protein
MVYVVLLVLCCTVIVGRYFVVIFYGIVAKVLMTDELHLSIFIFFCVVLERSSMTRLLRVLFNVSRTARRRFDGDAERLSVAFIAQNHHNKGLSYRINGFQPTVV